jgi:hypothetical protein
MDPVTGWLSARCSASTGERFQFLSIHPQGVGHSQWAQGPKDHPDSGGIIDEIIRKSAAPARHSPLPLHPVTCLWLLRAQRLSIFDQGKVRQH